MPYVAPSTVVAGQTYSASAHNVIVNDVIDHESRIVTAESDIVTVENSIRRLGYVTRTTDYVVSSNTIAGATDLFASDLTFTAIAATAYRVEFYCTYLSTGTGAGDNCRIHLVDGSGNDLGMMAFVGNGDGTRRAENQVFAIYNYTPGAGSISLNIRPTKGGGNGNLGGGTGGSGQNMPAYLAVYGPAIT